MTAYESENIVILNMKGIDYRCVIWGLSRCDAINRINDTELDDKDSL